MLVCDHVIISIISMISINQLKTVTQVIVTSIIAGMLGCWDVWTYKNVCEVQFSTKTTTQIS
jgi:hypothetical protein